MKDSARSSGGLSRPEGILSRPGSGPELGLPARAVAPTGLGQPDGFLARWLRFWFAPGDPVVLGAIRICTGLILLYVLLATTPWLWAVYGPDGWVDLATADRLRTEVPWGPPANGWDESPAGATPVRPGQPPKGDLAEYRKVWKMDPEYALDEGQAVFSVWYHVTGPVAQLVLHLAILLVMLAFTLGLLTRVTGVLAWVGMLSYCHRTQNANFGMDTMLAILLLYLMISPCGAALSLDRLLASLRWRRTHPDEPFPPPAPSASATFALRLLQLHFCIIYLASGLSKLQGAAWWSGTAIWQTVANYEFAGPHGALVTGVLRFLAENRWLWELAMSGGCLFTLVLEISFAYLVWLPRWRWLCLLGAVLLHTGIALTMGGLMAFSLAMLAIALSFVPAETVHWALDQAARLASRGQARPRREAQARPAELVRAG